MIRYIAFLRAINVGKGRSVKMNTLRQIFMNSGYAGVETFIASGNVVFQADEQATGELEEKIENNLLENLGLNVDVFIRTEAELARLAQYEPFPDREKSVNTETNIIFLASQLDDQTEHQVMVLSDEMNILQVHGREIYWLRKIEPGTGFSNPPLEKIVRLPFTIRNMRTIRKMAEKYS